VDLGIWTSGFSLQLSDLSIGIFIRVIGHFWQQGRVIEGFNLPLERDILQLESWHSDLLVLIFISYLAFGGIILY
jgi:hypothetical protein